MGPPRPRRAADCLQTAEPCKSPVLLHCYICASRVEAPASLQGARVAEFAALRERMGEAPALRRVPKTNVAMGTNGR